MAGTPGRAACLPETENEKKGKGEGFCSQESGVSKWRMD